MKRTKGRLWRNPDFSKLWFAQTISKTGSSITREALPLTALLILAASPAQMAILGALAVAPVLLIGLFAGVWVDRLRRRPLLIAADWGRAVLIGSIPLAALFGWLRIEQLYIVAGLAGILTVFFDVADQSFLPSVIKQDELVEGNSKLGAGSSVAEISGPPIGGVLVQFISAPFALLLDASSFVISALFIGAIRTTEVAPDQPLEKSNVWREIAEGLRAVLGNKILRALALSSGCFNFFGNFIGVLYAYYSIRELGISPAILGFLTGAGGVGALIGALLVEQATHRFGIGKTITGSLLFVGCMSFILPTLAGPVWFVAAVMVAIQLIGDITIAIYMINEVSLRQSVTPLHLLGRTNASMHFLVMGLGPLGILLAGLLAELIGVRLTLLISACGILAGAISLLFSPVPHLHTMPTAAPDEKAEILTAPFKAQ